MEKAKWAAKAFLAGIVSLVILSGVTLIFNYTSTRMKCESGATDFNWPGGQYMSTMNEGNAWIHMDSKGYNNEAAIENPDILLMGSSHMEALQMKTEENIGYLLNHSALDLSAYNIGISGHTIYRCVDNMANAYREYRPRSYIILETDRVDLDILSMQEVLDGTSQKVAASDSGIMYQLQKVPCIKALYNKVKNWIEVGSQSGDTVRTPEDAALYSSTLHQFLSKAAASAGDTQLIIFYHPSESLTDGGIEYTIDREKMAAFESVCEELGIRFICMEDAFREAYVENNIFAHGFSNTGVCEGHLNADGHRICADVLIETIEKMEKNKR